MLVVPSQSFDSPDILTYPSVFGNRLARLYNNGDGEFNSVSALGEKLPGLPVALLGGRFADPEGTDVAVISTNSSGEISAQTKTWVRVLGDAGGRFVSEEEFPFVVFQATSGDLNGDGLDDLVMSGRVLSESRSNDVIWLVTRLHDGSGFEEPVEIPLAGGAIGPMLVNDFTGDGLSDLVTSNPSGGELLFHEAFLSPSLGSYQDWAENKGVSADGSGDTDLDGSPDLTEFLSGRNPVVAETSATGQPGSAALARFEPIYTDSLNISFEHPRPRQVDGGTATVELEASEDMKTWIPVEAVPRVRLTQEHPGWEIWSWQFYESGSQGTGRKFFRFKTSIQ